MKTNVVNKTLINRITDFMESKTGGVATLKEIYNHVKNDIIKDGEVIPNNFKEKIRCVIYRNNKLKRVTKGMYLYMGANSAGLILHGDGRKLEEIEDNSIDSILTDHPWSDKKAHKSGNQKNFAADYEDNCFRYTQEDFNQKARVLKDGGYLIEFLPTESFSNYKYLYEIKEMAEKAGFEYYAKLMWMKAPEGAINTGRTTKGIEDIMIFTKGKGRRLAPDKKPYLTKFILPGRLDIPAPKPKDKRHQAEKNVSVYEFLLKATTEEGDIALDQFGGSLNLIEAAVNTNRFGIVYEYLAKFVHKAVNRLKAIPLFVSEEDIRHIENVPEENTIELEDILGYEPEVPLVVVDIADDVVECIEEASNSNSFETVVVKPVVDTNDSKSELSYEITEGNLEQTSFLVCESKTKEEALIPKEISEFQLDMLLKLSKTQKKLFKDTDLLFLNNLDVSKRSDSNKLNELFSSTYDMAYEQCYKRISTNLSVEQNTTYKNISSSIKKVFEEKLPNKYLRSFYKNYVIEAEDFAKYMIKKHSCKSYDEIKAKSIDFVNEYLNIVSSHPIFKNKNIVNVKTMILHLFV